MNGPSADVPPPNPAILAAPGVRQARPGVVRVVGSACGLGIEGSGWIAGPGEVVTDAHVVAGEADTRSSSSTAGRLACTPTRSSSMPATTSPSCASPD